MTSTTTEMEKETVTMTTEELERMTRKLKYQESTIIKMLSSYSTSSLSTSSVTSSSITSSHSKICVVKEKIEQLDQMVAEIPDYCSDMFDFWMDKTVELWNLYKTTLSDASNHHHRQQQHSQHQLQSKNNKCAVNLNNTSQVNGSRNNAPVTNIAQPGVNKKSTKNGTRSFGDRICGRSNSSSNSIGLSGDVNNNNNDNNNKADQLQHNSPIDCYVRSSYSNRARPNRRQNNSHQRNSQRSTFKRQQSSAYRP
ncbi:hypothetical protein BLOT_014540 [Blomia tropicalis]|nr:hypothetical protein BLOT_014540 [Blomia tropicalis]